MAKQVVILGKCGREEDVKVVRAVARFVATTQPDEVVCIEGSTTLLERLREGYGGPLRVHGSATDESFDDVLAGFDARLAPEYYRLAPGWITTDKEDKCPPSRIPGSTALNTARTFNICVALGHTGRMGLCTHTYGFGGHPDKYVTGMEVGTLMDRKAARSFGGQQGFGLLAIDGQRVTPETVAIHRGEFTVGGHTWAV
jgi:hypothetical protein